MNKLFTTCVLVIAMTVANLSTASDRGRFNGYYAWETQVGVRMVYNLALLNINVATLETGLEPVICWPFPVDWYEFLAPIQANVDEQVLAYPKRLRSKLAPKIQWFVWHAVQDEYGC